MEEKKGSLKGTYENAKRYSIALWAERQRDCSLEEESLIVDYKGKIITVQATLDKQKRRAEFKDALELELSNINEFLCEKKSFKELKADYEEFVENVASITNTGKGHKFDPEKTKEQIIKLAKRFGDAVATKIEKIIKEVK